MTGKGQTLWSRGKRWARLGGLLVLASAAAFAAQKQDPAKAQGALPITRSYVTPFPEGDRYKLRVFGDSLAEGTWSGLRVAFPANGAVDVDRETKPGNGFARISRFDWNRQLDSVLKSGKTHIAVVMIGTADNRTIWYKKRSLDYMSPEWKKVYGARLDQFMKRLKKSKVAVYWVGMPIMGKPKFNEAMQSLNDLMRERAFVNGIKFIDTWNGFTDQFGRYSVYGPDLSGRVRRLRANDGVHFTGHGYRKLAHFVEQEIRKDLKAARQEREIPLAGDEAEQQRATGHTVKKVKQAARKSGKANANPKGKGKDGGKIDQIAKLLKGPAPNAEPGSGVKKTRKPVSPGVVKNPLHGETIANEMSMGLTALASISSLNDTSTKEGHRRLPLAERPYYKVLVKGNAVRAKLNRADEFAWPPG